MDVVALDAFGVVELEEALPPFELASPKLSLPSFRFLSNDGDKWVLPDLAFPLDAVTALLPSSERCQSLMAVNTFLGYTKAAHLRSPMWLGRNIEVGVAAVILPGSSPLGSASCLVHGRQLLAAPRRPCTVSACVRMRWRRSAIPLRRLFRALVRHFKASFMALRDARIDGPP